jgi:hypothetical protein
MQRTRACPSYCDSNILQSPQQDVSSFGAGKQASTHWGGGGAGYKKTAGLCTAWQAAATHHSLLKRQVSYCSCGSTLCRAMNWHSAHSPGVLCTAHRCLNSGLGCSSGCEGNEDKHKYIGSVCSQCMYHKPYQQVICAQSTGASTAGWADPQAARNTIRFSKAVHVVSACITSN